MDAIHQTRFFAKNYSQMQGLRAVPISLCLLVITWWANLQHGPARDLTLPLLIAIACLALYLLVDRFYNRAYGKVKRSISLAELFIQAGGAVLALAAFILDTMNLVQISLLGLVFAVVFVLTGYWYWRPIKVLLGINLVLALIFAGLSIAPVFGILDWWSPLGLRHSMLAFTFLFGVFGVISGAVSHLYFVHSLPAPQEAE